MRTDGINILAQKSFFPDRLHAQEAWLLFYKVFSIADEDISPKMNGLTR
jgi:hypothetical protein